MSNKRKTKPVVSSGPATKNRVVLGYLHPGQVSAYFTQSLMNLLMFDQATERRVVGCLNEWSSANISDSRNSVVRNFLGQYDAEWLLFIDSDMAFEHDALDQLFKTADPVKYPILGGLCFGSVHGELFPTIYQMGADEDGDLTTMRLTDYPIDELIECAATGGAFLMIHRDVLKRMRRQFNDVFPWFQETTMGPRPVSEDITFCLRAGQLGYKVHVDTSIKVGHHKTVLLTAEMFQGQKAQRVPEDAHA